MSSIRAGKCTSHRAASGRNATLELGSDVAAALTEVLDSSNTTTPFLYTHCPLLRATLYTRSEAAARQRSFADAPFVMAKDDDKSVVEEVRQRIGPKPDATNNPPPKKLPKSIQDTLDSDEKLWEALYEGQ